MSTREVISETAWSHHLDPTSLQWWHYCKAFLQHSNSHSFLSLTRSYFLKWRAYPYFDTPLLPTENTRNSLASYAKLFSVWASSACMEIISHHSATFTFTLCLYSLCLYTPTGNVSMSACINPISLPRPSLIIPFLGELKCSSFKFSYHVESLCLNLSCITGSLFSLVERKFNVNKIHLFYWVNYAMDLNECLEMEWPKKEQININSFWIFY